jgi:hypothetical protein
MLTFSPPNMAEALLTIDGDSLHVCIGDKRRLADSRVMTETVFGRLGQYKNAPYPITIETRTHEDGKVVRSRSSSVTGVESVAELSAVQFSTNSSPRVASPQLPGVPYTVNIKISDGAVIVPCRAPDGTTLNLALDTGANIGLLRRSVAQRIGLKPTGSEQVSGHGATAQVGYVRAEGLRIGDAPIPAWPAAVLQNAEGLDNKLGFAGVDGLLGNHLLHNYVVQIDYPAAKLRLWPRDRFDPHAVTDAFAAPLHRERLPYSDVVIDGKIRGGAYFNTGGRYVFGLAFWACDDAGITYPVESMGRGVSVGGSAMFGLIRPGLVRLEGLGAADSLSAYGSEGKSATSITVNGEDEQSPSGLAVRSPQDLVLRSPLTTLELLAPGEPMQRYRIGSFGSLFLRDYVVTFDLAREKVYLARP